MAAPIKFEPVRRDAQEELLERLEQAPAEHVEALLAVYDLVQGLHDRGVLDALNGALNAGNFILETAVETVGRCQPHGAAQNRREMVARGTTSWARRVFRPTHRGLADHFGLSLDQVNKFTKQSTGILAARS